MTDIPQDMIERACKAYHLGIYGYPCLITDMQRKGMEAVIREVLQMVEEAQTADTYRIKPLEWEEGAGMWIMTDKHHKAFGRVFLCIIYERQDHEIFDLRVNGKWSHFPTLEAAKAAAEAHWRAILLDSVLEEV